MAGNLSQFSDATWSTGEAVTVNTRALIDKVLARYSAEHTVFRELFQNAADADARHVVLKWESMEEMLQEVDLKQTGLPMVAEEKESHGDGGENKDGYDGEEKSGDGRNLGVLENPPQPPPPYFETPVGKKNSAGLHNDINGTKDVKKKRSLFSRLKNTFSNGNLSATASSSKSTPSPASDSTPRFSTTGSNPARTPPLDKTGYAQSNEVLRNLIWNPVAKKGDEPSKKLYRRLIVQNDGKAFGAADWSRLKRIAEGNPDESKIGAFGVGFYSVFSECDEPAVFSGGKAMAFYWDGDRENGGGNQLMTRTAEAGNNADDGWTVFNLPYRKPTPLPEIPDLVKFLATSLVFVKLESITVYVDGLKLFSVEKSDVNPPVNVALPKSVVASRAAAVNEGASGDGGIKMNVTQVSLKQIAMRAIYIDGIFWQAGQGTGKDKERETELRVEEISLEISTANIVTDVHTTIASELKRAILKPPPKETTLSMVSASVMAAIGNTNETKSYVFSSIVPRTTPQNELPVDSRNESGRVFIGFQTHQTTGFQCHLSTHSVIPTVERENIDFNARYVKDWNFEILRMAGILARTIYDNDMHRLQRFIEASQDLSASKQIAKRIMQKFAFRQSTPSPHVGDIVKTSFFELGGSKYQAVSSSRPHPTRSLIVMSAKGIKTVGEIKLPVSNVSPHKSESTTDVDCNWLVEEFLESVPIMTKELVEASPIFVVNLIELGVLLTLEVTDVLQDLRTHVLQPKQAASLLSWLAKACDQPTSGITSIQIPQVLREASVALPNLPNSPKGSTMKLNSIKYFISSWGPLARLGDLPIPPSCISPNLLSPELRRSESLGSIFGWTELRIERWVNHISITDNGLSTDDTFASNVLRVINSGWSSYDNVTRAAIKQSLDLRRCIPTGSGHGMCLPSRVHFPDVIWATSLPILAPDLAPDAIGGVSMDFLSFLGVRKTVELRRVLEKLMSEVTKASHNGNGNSSDTTCNQAELVSYLLTVQEKIPPGDMRVIQNMAFCSAENGKKLYKPSDLYEPREELRQLSLPTLLWPKPWEEISFAERKVLEDLGVKRAPDIITLAKIAAMPGYEKQTSSLRDRALKYMEDNWSNNNYKSSDAQLRTIRFLPIEDPVMSSTRSSQGILVNMTECYLHPRAGILGFNVLRGDLKGLASRLQIKDHPLVEDLVTALTCAPPRDNDQARAVFTYMAQFNSQLTKPVIDQLRPCPIVPIMVKSASNTVKSISSGSRPQGQALNSEASSSSQSKAIYEMRKPSEIYTSSLDSAVQVAMLFDFVDFGVLASQFLQKLGAKTSPSDLDVAMLQVADPFRVFEGLGYDEYYKRLKSLAVSRQELWPVGSELERQMRTSRFLIGEFTVKLQAAKDGYDSDDDGLADKRKARVDARLVSSSEVLVADDYTTYKIFREAIIVCPMDEILEEMYSRLGSLHLSTCVSIKYHTGSILKETAAAEALCKRIVERVPLFSQDSHSASNLKVQVRKWLPTISVKFVSHIRLDRKLQQMHTIQRVKVENEQVTTAAIPEITTSSKIGKGESDGTSVLVTTGWTFYDLAYALVGRLCRETTPGGISLMECVLREDLKTLDRRGFNVHRIRQAQAEETKLISIKQPANSTQAASSASPPISKVNETIRVNETTTTPPVVIPNDKVLKNALNAAKEFSGSTISSIPKNVILEPQTYCDHIPGHELVLQGKLSNGVKVFVEQGKSFNFTKYKADFESFSVLLVSIATAMGVTQKSIHLCYEPEGRTIAFNSGGSLFFNLHYWHANGHNQQTDEARTNSVTYWYMVVCHELAHNLVHAHSPEHTSHIQNIAAKNLPNIARLLPNAVVDDQGKMSFKTSSTRWFKNLFSSKSNR